MNEIELNQKIMNYAQTATIYAKKFKKTLNFSSDSIRAVEKMLDYFSRDLNCGFIKRAIKKLFKKELTETHVTAMAYIWGAYVGETIRLRLGEECKWVDGDASCNEFGLYLLHEDTKINPIEKVYKRLKFGPSENVRVYYLALFKK